MRKRGKDFNYRQKRNVVIVVSIVISAAFYFISNTSSSYLFSARNASFFIRIVSTIVLLLAFYAFDHIYNLRFNIRHYAFAILIVLSSIILSPLYFVFPEYDKILHFIQPMLFSSIVLYSIFPLKIDLKWMLAFTFFIVIGVLGLFEIGEYLLDIAFDWRLQGVYLLQGENLSLLMNRIDDTMIDMIIGTLGTLVYILSVGIIYRNRRK